MSGPWLRALRLGDPPDRWSAIGFDVDCDVVGVGGVRLELGAAGSGIADWELGPEGERAEAAEPHPNGAVAVDHVVLLTGDFDATARRLEGEGMPLRRIREVPVTARESFRQGFRRLGPAVLEVVETRDSPRAGERFWGITFTVEDLEATAEWLGERLGRAHDAVQPGRRIATLRGSVGLGCAVAFITPEPGG